MSQKKVNFLKKSNIQINKTLTASKSEAVESISGVIQAIVEETDIIIDAEMPTDLGGVTLDQ